MDQSVLVLMVVNDRAAGDAALAAYPELYGEVERKVPYAKERFFKGSDFHGLPAEGGSPALVSGGGRNAHP